jgi:hypothetical protein
MPSYQLQTTVTESGMPNSCTKNLAHSKGIWNRTTEVINKSSFSYSLPTPILATKSKLPTGNRQQFQSKYAQLISLCQDINYPLKMSKLEEYRLKRVLSVLTFPRTSAKEIYS